MNRQSSHSFARPGRRALALAAIAIVTFGPTLTVSAPTLAQGPESVADIVEGRLDAVVNISTSQTVRGSRGIPMPRVPEGSPFQEFFDEFFNRRGGEGQNNEGNNNQPRRVQSLGSGFVIDASGVIVTNNHVIEDADEITANFNDGTRLIATVIGRDPKTDIAVLKVEPTKPLRPLGFGDSSALRIGDWVMAIGNPFGLGGTVTVGIVSARNRDINSGPYDDFLQTDAAINRGNSGGPLFNMQGEVIGINTAIISPTGGSIGIGFAVPSEIATRVIGQLREFGETRRGWIGVRIQEVTDEIAEGLGMANASGALVAGVTEDGPAAKAGIQPGDVILQFDGKSIGIMRSLPRIVADTDIGKEVDVLVLRRGERHTLKATVEKLDEGTGAEVAAVTPDQPDARPSQSSALGLVLSPLTAAMRDQYDIDPGVRGVVVTEVAQGSSAADKGVRPGDVVIEVSLEPVTSPAEIEARIEQLKKDGRRTALLLLADKSGELRFVPVRIEE